MPDRRAAGVFLLVPALVACACARDRRTPRPAPGDTVRPTVIAPQVGPAGTTIRIAAVFPTIGRYAASGRQSLNGARLAAEEIGARGGVHGRPLELVEYRTGSYFVDARAAAELAVAAGAVALVGSNSSSLSLPMAEIAEARRVPQLTNVSTAQDLTWDPETGVKRSFVFRLCPPDLVEGRLLARFARERMGARRAAVLYEVGRTYSARLARAFAEEFTRAGGEVRELHHLPLETDFRPQLRGIAHYAPDVLFLPGSFSDATLVALQAGRAGLRAALLGGDAWANRLLFKRAAPPGEAYYADLCVPTPGFLERYRTRFGQESDGCRAVLAYDAVQAVARAFTKMPAPTPDDLSTSLARTRVALRAALAGIDFEGEGGRVRFDDKGDVRRGIAVMRARAGGAVLAASLGRPSDAPAP